MDADFWTNKWQRNEIGFHKPEVNQHLISHLPVFKLTPNERLFVPLCGKTLDIGWLLENRFRVVAIELSELAVQQLFQQLRLDPTVTEQGKLKLYSAEGIDVFVGDFFDLSASMLGQVNAVYDRAAYIALPTSIRKKYSEFIAAITGNSPQLLVTLNYQPGVISGPPFSIEAEEVKQNYSLNFELTILNNTNAELGLKGMFPVQETVWHMA